MVREKSGKRLRLDFSRKLNFMRKICLLCFAPHFWKRPENTHVELRNGREKAWRKIVQERTLTKY